MTIKLIFSNCSRLWLKGVNSYETKKEKFAPTGEFKLKLLENRGDSPNTSMNLQIEIGNGVMLKTKG